MTTKGLNVEGVEGGHAHKCSRKQELKDESLLSLAGVGASTLNECSISKMGMYRDRLLFSRSPVVGYGAAASNGSSLTVAPDGSSTWAVDDEVLPETFFDANGKFVDSMQARLHSRLSINFGNPYKFKRGNQIIPDAYSSQRPSRMSFDENQVPSKGCSSNEWSSPPHSLGSPHLILGSPPLASPPHGERCYLIFLSLHNLTLSL